VFGFIPVKKGLNLLVLLECCKSLTMGTWQSRKSIFGTENARGRPQKNHIKIAKWMLGVGPDHSVKEHAFGMVG
jgi:hypothetical protein